ncbi:MAG: rhomboid family intramembrane serine protease [Actinobacteria bacterium]|nr:rhomboid family intramembrane serine protease [Actinomycetota bacterium]
MFPLRDNIPSRTFPFVNVSIIGLNFLVYFYQLTLGQERVYDFVFRYALIPAKVTEGLMTGANQVFTLLGFFTSMFIHLSLWHILGNMYFLWIFGDNVEDMLGHFGYLLFYLFSGLMAGGIFYLSARFSDAPTIGASGAVAGVLGAYFILYPRARVLTFVPIFFIFELPALIFLGIWIVIQFFYALSSVGYGAGSGMVAWWAHIGGFVSGVVLILIFKKMIQKRYYTKWS